MIGNSSGGAITAQILVTQEDGGGTPASHRGPLPSILGPAEALEVLTQFIDAGASHLVLAPAPPIPSDQRAHWLADELVAPVIAAISEQRGE